MVAYGSVLRKSSMGIEIGSYKRHADVQQSKQWKGAQGWEMGKQFMKMCNLKIDLLPVNTIAFSKKSKAYL